MRRGVIAAVALAGAATGARAEEPAAETAEEARLPDQALGGSIGVAAGGRSTPGGVRVTGHYLYQLSDRDWFDGVASFTFGGGDPGCFRDRDDRLVCDHGLAAGGAIELAIGVRRMFAAQGRYRPFARAAIGVGLARFGGDDVAGLAIPLHAGAGLRAHVADGVGIVALADVALGVAWFGRGLGAEPQLGLAITAGVELALP